MAGDDRPTPPFGEPCRRVRQADSLTAIDHLAPLLASVAALALFTACTEPDKEPDAEVASAACAAPPADWVGDWGSRPGVYVNCGGMAGACSVFRSEGGVSFTVLETGMLVRGGKSEKLCVRKTDAIYGGNHWYASDAFAELVVGVRGDVMTQADNAHDGFSATLERLTDKAPAQQVPEWFARDWRVTSGGTRCKTGCYLRVGANDAWGALVSNDPKRHVSAGMVAAFESGDGKTFQLELKANQNGHSGVYSGARDGETLRLTGPGVRPWTKGHDRPPKVTYTLEPGVPPER